MISGWHNVDVGSKSVTAIKNWDSTNPRSYVKVATMPLRAAYAYFKLKLSNAIALVSMCNLVTLYFEVSLCVGGLLWVCIFLDMSKLCRLH